MLARPVALVWAPVWLALAICLGTAVGCKSKPAEPAKEHSAEKASPEHEAEEAEPDLEPGEGKAKGKGRRKRAKPEPPAPEPVVETRRFAVPFVWETSPDDPLARARGHLKEILSDNARYIKERGPRFFDAFAEGQKPRSTMVMCADSRMQVTALDATPENDAFVIRNIGNQLENAVGSVEYGIESLRTSVLMIVGHTGCGAVKAALGKLDALSEPIRRELSPMKLSQQGTSDVSDEVWTEAVVENVNNQVKLALDRFTPLVQEGKLTVVGAVFDFRNDMKQGSGKLVLVNVNGNVDPAAVQAFTKAVTSDGKIVMQARSDSVPALQARAEPPAAELSHPQPARAEAPRRDPSQRAASLLDNHDEHH